ncbi:helix-turn-helix domain-containing protein [Sedimentibacter sp.]|uniref:helix-turn-helix domain-containing protein n=1 Tax=Sedimentibacter sp. TaxID=1960295 RepID=UPI0028AD7743|nr:helix-turn-helix domain-containing protein [Sedimentibacter sp.]
MKGANKAVVTNIEDIKEIIIEEKKSASVPTMCTIQEMMHKTGFSYRQLMRMCKENKIVHIRVGNKYLINYEKFIDYLSIGEVD